METKFEKQIVSAKEDLEIIKIETKEIEDLKEYITNLEKEIKRSDSNEISIKEYNRLVNEYNEFVEEYNERIKALKELVNENYKGAV
ncbi:TPA: hypothetical protein ACYIXH_002747 [Staphylococcus aureus]